MKKNQFISTAGKKLSKKDMQTVKGGWWGGIWTCTNNGYQCYFTIDECDASCPDSRWSCMFVFACP